MIVWYYTYYVIYRLIQFICIFLMSVACRSLNLREKYHHHDSHDNQVRVIQTVQLPMTLGINLNDVSTQLLGPRLLGRRPVFRDVRHGVSWWQDTKSPVLSHFFADLLPENSQTTQLLIHVSDYEFVILSGTDSAQAHTGSFGYLSHNLDNDNECSDVVSPPV